MVTKKMIREVMAELGRKGGAVMSPAKLAACRKNAILGGAKGGRPRKKKSKRK